MRYFFIDLENVRSAGLEGVLMLDEQDIVYVFYSDNCYTLTIPVLESINRSRATVRYIKTNYIGSNAMDFQIVSMFGAMIERQKQGFFYIISHDHGFRSAVSFCESYFTEYDIHPGVYDTIIAALGSESKQAKSVKGQKQNTQSQADKQAAKEQRQAEEAARREAKEQRKAEEAARHEAKEQRKAEEAARREAKEQRKAEEAARREAKEQRRAEEAARREAKEQRRAEEEQKRLAREAKAQAVEDEAEDAEAAVSVTDDKTGDAETVKRRRRRRSRGHKNHDTEAATETVATDSADSTESHKRSEKASAVAENRPTVKETAKPAAKPARYGYIYDALSGLLSEKTIDIYAAKIDEAIGQAQTKDELYDFFFKHYNPDEAEALYRVIQGDFAELKKKRK